VDRIFRTLGQQNSMSGVKEIGLTVHGIFVAPGNTDSKSVAGAVYHVGMLILLKMCDTGWPDFRKYNIFKNVHTHHQRECIISVIENQYFLQKSIRNVKTVAISALHIVLGADKIKAQQKLRNGD